MKYFCAVKRQSSVFSFCC